MKAEKRKRETDGKEVVGAPVDDDEVEEFFTILRRIHVAVKYFENNNNRSSKNNCKRWKTRSFEKEVIEDVNSGRVELRWRKEKEESFVGENTGLDLNSDPPPSEDNSA
ncbi:uncharacterized protein LOC8285793 [Ricinus communis]|uniref:Uncharacterized protein n=1 Tax=Ricinus communis TaxID=3988 RepID=B9T067_RICCO|nr:uncharacterized protein LOC8285793 [Ricinus communis]EEF30764.1 conserved hypothetical protein [Ricinus communis]|eukprot:XP_015582372.1 uncharacterized protein LOC8285793 [Ricinus communis]